MNQQLFINGQAKFPVSTEALDFIQQQIFLVARLASIAGTNVIITPATTTTDGLVVVNGELLPLLNGTTKQYIQIVETKQSIVAGAQTFTDVRITRYAQYANSGTPVSQFTTLDNIVTLMSRISAIEGSYMTETAIRALVQAVQTNLNTTNSNLSSLTTCVQTIENNYKTAAQITELLNANAQHHLPKGSIIDWYGTADCDHLPYGFVPCGCFFAGSASQFAPDGAGTREIAKWKAKYPSIQIGSNAIGSKVGIRIYDCNSQTVPDLTDRFIVQAGGSYKLGDTGGAETVTLTREQMPQHIHGRGTWNSQGGFKVVDQAGGLTKNGAFTEKNRESTNIKANGGDDNWRVTVEYDWAQGLTGSLGTAGGSQAHENRPPFYALYKLIKVI